MKFNSTMQYIKLKFPSNNIVLVKSSAHYQVVLGVKSCLRIPIREDIYRTTDQVSYGYDIFYSHSVVI